MLRQFWNALPHRCVDIAVADKEVAVLMRTETVEVDRVVVLDTKGKVLHRWYAPVRKVQGIATACGLVALATRFDGVLFCRKDRSRKRRWATEGPQRMWMHADGRMYIHSAQGTTPPALQAYSWSRQMNNDPECRSGRLIVVYPK